MALHHYVRLWFTCELMLVFASSSRKFDIFLINALQREPTRSASASRPCSRCRQKRVEVDLEVDAGETITLDEVNHFSSSLSNAAVCYDSTSKSTSLPINVSPAPTAILIGGGSEGGTESSASHEIPIPIFTSSQYSIQRRRTRSTPRSSKREQRRPTVNHIDIAAHNKNTPTARVFSIDYGKFHGKHTSG